jgi:hypothetical protein
MPKKTKTPAKKLTRTTSKKSAAATKKSAAATKKSAAAKAPAKPPTASALAATLGVTLTTPLTTAQVQRLLKPLPGYVGLLDDVADQLDEDASLLNLRGITGAALLALQTRQKALAARESVSQIVYNSVYQQRQQVDSDAMGALFQINKRVLAMKSEDPDLAARWSFLTDFLRKFHPGTNAAKLASEQNRADAKAARKSLAVDKKGKSSPPAPTG